MNGLPYYQAYPRDFIEGTVGMPFEIKCAYRVVLDLIYMHGGDLPDDARYISGILGCSIRKWKSIRNSLVEIGKLQVSGEFLTNYRAVSMLETTAKYQRKQSENRRTPNKNKDLQSPPLHHTDTDTDTEEKRDTKVSPKKARGSRLSDDWVLPKEWGEWALSQGWSETAVRLEADKFRDFWISKAGKDATKLDWLATWRNWLRNSKTPKIINGGKSNDTGQSIAERVAARFGEVDSGEGADASFALLPTGNPARRN